MEAANVCSISIPFDRADTLFLKKFPFSVHVDRLWYHGLPYAAKTWNQRKYSYPHFIWRRVSLFTITGILLLGLWRGCCSLCPFHYAPSVSSARLGAVVRFFLWWDAVIVGIRSRLLLPKAVWSRSIFLIHVEGLDERHRIFRTSPSLRLPCVVLGVCERSLCSHTWISVPHIAPKGNFYDLSRRWRLICTDLHRLRMVPAFGLPTQWSHLLPLCLRVRSSQVQFHILTQDRPGVSYQPRMGYCPFFSFAQQARCVNSTTCIFSLCLLRQHILHNLLTLRWSHWCWNIAPLWHPLAQGIRSYLTYMVLNRLDVRRYYSHEKMDQGVRSIWHGRGRIDRRHLNYGLFPFFLSCGWSIFRRI